MNTQIDQTSFIANAIANPKPAQRARNGKIARLPKPARDLINRMLEDGLPAHIIIDELGDAGEGLNPQNITNWRQGGYQDYLRNQQAIERSKAQFEFATDLLRESAGADPLAVHQATRLLASLQLLNALREHGDLALRKLFQTNPAKYFNAIHSVCALSNSELDAAKHQLRTQTAPPLAGSPHPSPAQAPSAADSTAPPPSAPASPSPVNVPESSPIKPNQGLAVFSGDCTTATAPSSPIKPNQGLAVFSAPRPSTLAPRSALLIANQKSKIQNPQSPTDTY